MACLLRFDFYTFICSPWTQGALVILLQVLFVFLIVRIILISLARQRRQREKLDETWRAQQQQYLSGLPLQPPPAPAPRFCSRCGASLDGAAAFCRQCGTRHSI